jgi:hypothetical protein
VCSRQLCHKGAWSAPITVQVGPSPEGFPELLPFVPLEERFLERVRAARTALKLNLECVYKGEVFTFWEEMSLFQETLYAGEFPEHERDTRLEDLFPCSSDTSPTWADPEEAAGHDGSDEYEGFVPGQLVHKVYPPVREVYTGSRKQGLKKDAGDYLRGRTLTGAATADYEVTYDMMRSGGMAVFLAQEDSGATTSSNLTFRIKLTKDRMSPLLMLCEMMGVADEAKKQLKWLYYGVSKFSNKVQRMVTPLAASKTSAFLKPVGVQIRDLSHTAEPWEQSEKPILSWDPGATEHYREPKTCIPTEQFKQLKIVLVALSMDQEEMTHAMATADDDDE